MDFSTVPVDKILKMPVGELNAHIAHMEAVLEVFQTVRRRLSAGGEPPASQPAAVAKKAKIAADKPKVKPKAKPTEREPIPMRILDELAFKIGVFLKANGPKRSDSIKNHLGCSDHELHEALKASAWFEKANGMYTLTSDGHVHFNGDR